MLTVWHQDNGDIETILCKPLFFELTLKGSQEYSRSPPNSLHNGRWTHILTTTGKNDKASPLPTIAYFNIRKNDSFHVEQKNWSVVRRLVGYDRYSSRTALEALNRVYDLLCLYANFSQPMMKVFSKTSHEAIS